MGKTERTLRAVLLQLTDVAELAKQHVKDARAKMRAHRSKA